MRYKAKVLARFPKAHPVVALPMRSYSAVRRMLQITEEQFNDET